MTLNKRNDLSQIVTNINLLALQTNICIQRSTGRSDFTKSFFFICTRRSSCIIDIIWNVCNCTTIFLSHIITNINLLALQTNTCIQKSRSDMPKSFFFICTRRSSCIINIIWNVCNCITILTFFMYICMLKLTVKQNVNH